MFCYDIESLDVESNAVILSLAVCHWNLGEQPTYEELMANGLFVKLKVEGQVERLGRSIHKGTLEWWGKQGQIPRKYSLIPNKEWDVEPAVAMRLVREYIKDKRQPGEDLVVWARGSLDQMATDSMTRALGEDPICSYNVWRDIRTAIDLMCKTAKNGYAEVDAPGFTWDKVVKHHPLHDVASDAMQLIYGK